MITDDPGTPGNGHWEDNVAVTFEHRSRETSWELPALDLNYGLGERVQLTLETSSTVLKRSGHGLIAGLGSTEAAVKWRFLDEDRGGVDISTFPRIIFNVVQSSVRRGLAEKGTRFQVPVELAKTIHSFEAGLEFGPLMSTVGRSEWIYGLIGGVHLSKTTEFMAELNGSARTNFKRDALTLNFGMRHQLSEHCIWIASLGHEVRAPAGESRALVGYCGVQLLF
jgi:hypothetical protein